MTCSENAVSPVYLNHVYIVVDEATFGDLRSSNFLINEFASVDTGLPDFLRPDSSANSIYVRGQHTYLELFGPDNEFEEPVGKVGVGTSPEQPGAIDWIYERLCGKDPDDVQKELIYWDSENESPVPWYTVVYRDQPDSTRLVPWVSEYHEDFLPALYSDKESGTRGIRREDYLRPQFEEDRYLQDITGLTVALHEPQKSRYIRDLELLGWVSHTDGDDSVLEGPNVRVMVTDATAERDGLLEIELYLCREKDGKQVYQFGPHSQLGFEGPRTATWKF